MFSVTDGSKLLEFRRGVKRCAHVYSLAFSQESDLLALSSNMHCTSAPAVGAGSMPVLAKNALASSRCGPLY